MTILPWRSALHAGAHGWRAVRVRRRAGLIATVVGTFTIAIGLNSAVFGVVRNVLLRDPPFERPDRLVIVEVPTEASMAVSRVSGTVFQSWADNHRVFEGMSGFLRRSVAVHVGERAWRTDAADVSPDLFGLLGVPLLLGRGFDAADAVAGAGCVAVIDDALWNGAFGRRDVAADLGLRVDGRACRVVGVISASHAFPDPAIGLWLALDPQPTVESVPGSPPRITSKSFGVIARLADGVSVPQAVDEMHRLYPRELGRARLVPLKDYTVRATRPLLVLLQVVAGLVLIAACLNVAGLLLADGLRRGAETAVKASLGASRTWLVTERLIELIVMAGAGGVLGMVLATWGTTLAQRALGIETRELSGTWQWGTAVATGAVTMAAALAAGLGPALKTCRANIAGLTAYKHQTGGSVGTDRSWRGLVCGEVSISLALIVVAVSLGTAVVVQVRTHRGYDERHVAVMEFSLPDESYPALEARQRFVDGLLADLRRQPGLQRAAAATNLAVSVSAARFSLEPPAPPTGEALFRGETALRYAFVSDAYFETLAMPLHQGRTFTAADAARTPPVAILSQAAAARDFGAGSPIGQSLRGFQGRNWQIVGVVGDIKATGINGATIPFAYFPLHQLGHAGDTASWRLRRVHVVAQATGNPAALLDVLRAGLSRQDPSLVPHGVATLRTATRNALSHINLYAVCFAVLAATGIVVASLGLFALLAHAVVHRRREFGVRIALGADPRRLSAGVVGDGMAMVAIGAAIGLPLAWALQRGLDATVSGLHYRWTGFVIAPAILVAIALVACALPARQASRSDPAVTLRSE